MINEEFEKTIAPFNYRVDREDGRASLSCYFIVDGNQGDFFNAVPPELHFGACGLDWEFLVRHFLENNESMKGIKNDIDFDSENGMFYASTYFPESLQKLALEFRNIFNTETGARHMKELFDNQRDILTEANKKDFIVTIREFENDVRYNCELFSRKRPAADDGVETYQFDKIATITIDRKNWELKCIIDPDDVFKNMYIGIHYDDCASEIRKFKKFYQTEIMARNIKKIIDRLENEQQLEIEQKIKKPKKEISIKR